MISLFSTSYLKRFRISFTQYKKFNFNSIIVKYKKFDDSSPKLSNNKYELWRHYGKKSQ